MATLGRSWATLGDQLFLTSCVPASKVTSRAATGSTLPVCHLGCSAGATLGDMDAVEPRTESLSQRELRNESGRVLREVGEGRSFVLTNSGVPVGRIVPIDAPAPALAIARPAKREGGWSALAIERKVATRSLAETLDDLREDRL